MARNTHSIQWLVRYCGVYLWAGLNITVHTVMLTSLCEMHYSCLGLLLITMTVHVCNMCTNHHLCGYNPHVSVITVTPTSFGEMHYSCLGLLLVTMTVRVCSMCANGRLCGVYDKLISLIIRLGIEFEINTVWFHHAKYKPFRFILCTHCIYMDMSFIVRWWHRHDYILYIHTIILHYTLNYIKNKSSLAVRRSCAHFWYSG